MKITNHCYIVQGLGYLPPWTVNAGIIAGNKKTLIIDSGPNTFVAGTIYGYAKAIRPENEILLINLEKHLDHIGGNSLFREMGVEIYGHKNINRKSEDFEGELEEYNQAITCPVRKEKREEKFIYENSFIVNPNIKVIEDFELDLGGIEVYIILTPGHTDTNISVYLPDDKVLYCADCLTNGYLPNLEAGKVEDWQVWLKTLEKLKGLKPDFIVPGHGPVLKGEKISEAFNRMEEILLKSIQAGVAPTVVNKLPQGN